MSKKYRLPNSERQLDGAKYFLDQLQANQQNPRAFYHITGALLKTVVSVRLALERTVPKNQFRSWHRKWIKGLPDQDQELVRIMDQTRNKDIHREGMSLLVGLQVEVGANNANDRATITLCQGEAPVSDVTVEGDTTGVFEAAVGADLAIIGILGTGEFSVAVSTGEARTSKEFNAHPVYRFDRVSIKEDVQCICREFVRLAEKLFQDFQEAQRSGQV